MRYPRVDHWAAECPWLWPARQGRWLIISRAIDPGDGMTAAKQNSYLISGFARAVDMQEAH